MWNIEVQFDPCITTYIGVCKYNDKYVYRYEFDTLSSAFKKNPFFMYGWMYTFIEYEVFVG